MTTDTDEFQVQNKRKHGFYIIDHELLTVYAPKIKAPGIAVYNALVYHANKEDDDGKRKCWPSYKTLAQESGLSRSGVIAALEKLKEHGLIEVVPGRTGEATQDHDGKGWKGIKGQTTVSNTYILLPLKEYTPITRPSTPKILAPSTGEILGSTPEILGLVSQENYPSTPNKPELDIKNQINKNQKKENMAHSRPFVTKTVVGDEPAPITKTVIESSRPATVSIREWYKSQLAAIDKGEPPLTNSGKKKTPAGVIAEMIDELYGGKCNPAAVGAMGKQIGHAWKTFDFVLAHAKDEVKGDPIAYLLGCWKAECSRPRNGNGYSKPEVTSVQEMISNIPEEYRYKPRSKAV